MLNELESFLTYESQNKLCLVTWINHHTLMEISDSEFVLKKFTYVGVDGIFLLRLLRLKINRSSADIVIPKLLGSRLIRVILVGGKIENLSIRAARFLERFPKAIVLGNFDGYGTHLAENISLKVLESEPDIIILGLGPGYQEKVALQLSELLNPKNSLIVMTCGGWLDQLMYDQYYPSYAYTLRVNWLVRLLREPKRLWRRYSLEAIIAFRKRSLWKYVRNLDNLK